MPRTGPKPPALTNAERQARHREREAAKAAGIREAAEAAYAILCSGNPPHSAREANARRVLRQALHAAAT